MMSHTYPLSSPSSAVSLSPSSSPSSSPTSASSPSDTSISALFDVVLHSSASAVVAFLASSSISIDVQNGLGDTALLLAARRGELDVVRALLMHSSPPGADLHLCNMKGSNALIAASMKGHTDIVSLLLSRGADANHATDSRDTALSLAIWQNHSPVCMLLMDPERGAADVDHIDKFGDTMLLDAAKHGNVEVMRTLIDRQRELHIDHANKQGDTALIRAAWKGDVGAVELLLDWGASTTCANKLGANPLIMACTHGNRDCARLLIDRCSTPAYGESANATLDMVDSTGRSAFAYMCTVSGTHDGEPDWELIAKIVEAGCRIDQPPDCGNLLLCRAANTNQLAIVELLLHAGADVNFGDVNNRRRTPLMAHLQGSSPSLALVSLLVCTHHARVNDCDTDGATSLMFALQHNAPDIVGLLLDNGANQWIENNEGDTASVICMQIMQNCGQNMNQLQAMQTATNATTASSVTTATTSGGVGIDGLFPFPSSSPSSSLSNSTSSTELDFAQLDLDRAHSCMQLLLDSSAREMGNGALLLQAAQHGEVENIEELLTVGVTGDHSSASSSSTTSPSSASPPHLNVLSSILPSSSSSPAIDVNFSDKSGRTALMLSARGNHLGCVSLLLRYGALLNLRDKDGLTALTHAIRSGAREVAEELAETVQGHSIKRHYAFPEQSHTNSIEGAGGSIDANATISSSSSLSTLPSSQSSSSLSLPSLGVAAPSSIPFPSSSSSSSSIAGSGGGGIGSGSGNVVNAAIFGMKSTPIHQARDEFDLSTTFLRDVADQMERVLKDAGKRDAAASGGSADATIVSHHMKSINPSSSSLSSHAPPHLRPSSSFATPVPMSPTTMISSSSSSHNHVNNMMAAAPMVDWTTASSSSSHRSRSSSQNIVTATTSSSAT